MVKCNRFYSIFQYGIMQCGVGTKYLPGVINGVPVKVFGTARTVADCFKCRNKIGLDVALEALREGSDAKEHSRFGSPAPSQARP